MRKFVCAAGILMAALTACSGEPPRAATPAAFPAAPLPMYSAGDSYSFDDGTVETVVRADDTAVQWRSQTGAGFVTTRDVLLPPVAWQDGTVRGERTFPLPASLFPLRPGSGIIFNAVVTETSGSGVEPRRDEHWQCRVGPASRLRAGAAWFDTVEVDCEGTEEPGGRRVQRIFFYAPSIGYYVRRIERIGDQPPRTATLAAYTAGDPPLSNRALQMRLATIRRAVDARMDGKPRSWGEPGEAIGMVELLAAYNSGGRPCRRFQEQIEAYGRTYALRGEACHDGPGRWQVVRVMPAG